MQHKDLRLWPVDILIPDDRAGNKLTVLIPAGDLDHRNWRQFSGAFNFLAVAGNKPFILHLPQKHFQLRPVIALDIKGTGDLALADFSVRVLDEFQNFGFARKAASFLL